MPYLSLDGLPLYYERRGPPTGPLIVFFNGWCLSGRYWQPTIARLEADFSTLIFDSRGFGRSQVGRRAVGANYHASIEGGAAEAHALLGRLGLDSGQAYHVVGHSLGGVTAAHFAAQAEQQGRLASLTVVNSGSFGPEEAQGSQLETFVKLFVRIKGWFDLPVVRQAVVSRSVARPLPAAYARLITQDFALAEARLALELSHSSLAASSLTRYRGELAGLRAALLLVVGDRDATIPPKGMYNIARFRPDARLAAFADCGHLPMLESPTRFAEVLAEHITGSVGQPARL